MTYLWRFIDNFESYFCRFLLASFVTLLFTQIVSREVFGRSITWIEELSVFMFVWFVYFGASYAAKMAAHNRVTFQFGWMDRSKLKWIEAFADLFWIFFNVYFIYLSYEFVFNKMNLFWKAQTLGIPYKYIYMVLPFSFALMTIRILQVNYQRLIKNVEIEDPDKVDVEALEAELGKEAK